MAIGITRNTAANFPEDRDPLRVRLRKLDFYHVAVNHLGTIDKRKDTRHDHDLAALGRVQLGEIYMKPVPEQPEGFRILALPWPIAHGTTASHES
jgi:hypothetical protein